MIRRGVPAEKCSVVMNVADEEIFRPPVRRPVAPDTFSLIYHGTVTRRYGLDLAVRAIATLRDEIPGIRLTILGKGDAMPELAALRSELRLERNVELRDEYVHAEQLPDLIARADLGIVPYRDDVFTDGLLPTKLMEYAAMGVPCVAARTTAIEAYFLDTMVAFFTPGDADDLASRVRALYESPELRRDPRPRQPRVRSPAQLDRNRPGVRHAGRKSRVCDQRQRDTRAFGYAGVKWPVRAAPVACLVACLVVSVVGVSVLGIERASSSTTAAPSPERSLGSFRVECELSRQRRIDPITNPGGEGHAHARLLREHVRRGELDLRLDARRGEQLHACRATERATGRPRCSRRTESACNPSGDLLLPQPPGRLRPDRCVPARLPNGRRRLVPECVLDMRRRERRRPQQPEADDPGLRRGRQDQVARVLPVVLGRRTNSIPEIIAATSPTVSTRKDASPAPIPTAVRQSHPVKIPQLDFRVLYDVSDGSDYRLSSGGVIPHADFWNTWVQSDLRGVCVSRMPWPSSARSCGLVEDSQTLRRSDRFAALRPLRDARSPRTGGRSSRPSATADRGPPPTTRAAASPDRARPSECR